ESGTEELKGPYLDELRKTLQSLALEGLRVLAVAEKLFPEGHQLSLDSVQNLSFRGLIAFRDPIRKTAVQAIADLRRAGLRPLMVTGDHPSTAQAIAVEAQLSSAPQVMTGAELAELDEDELAARVGTIDVFARVSPSQKVRIVRALSKSGRIVAMV